MQSDEAGDDWGLGCGWGTGSGKGSGKGSGSGCGCGWGTGSGCGWGTGSGCGWGSGLGEEDTECAVDRDPYGPHHADPVEPAAPEPSADREVADNYCRALMAAEAQLALSKQFAQSDADAILQFRRERDVAIAQLAAVREIVRYRMTACGPQDMKIMSEFDSIALRKVEALLFPYTTPGGGTGEKT